MGSFLSYFYPSEPTLEELRADDHSDIKAYFDDPPEKEAFGEKLVARRLRGTVFAIEVYLIMLEKKVARLEITYRTNPYNMVKQSSAFYGVATSIIQAYGDLFRARPPSNPVLMDMRMDIEEMGQRQVSAFLSEINNILSSPRNTPRFDILKQNIVEQRRNIEKIKKIKAFADKVFM